MRKFWKWIDHKIRNQDSGEEATQRVLELYGTIAEESWFDDDITPQEFRDELFSGSGSVTVWINSPGGDCIAASQIYTMLMDYKGDVTVKIDGIAASAASVIAMAGTKVLMAPTGMMMLHNLATVAFGDHVDMEKAIEMLSEVKESIINAYEIKTSLPRKQLSKMMDETTWMNAKKAAELGFIDGILEDEKLFADVTGYAFSSNAVETALVNKISAKAPKSEAEPATETTRVYFPLRTMPPTLTWRPSLTSSPMRSIAWRDAMPMRRSFPRR